MPPTTGLNKNNAAIKRIMQEARELANDPCTDYKAYPSEEDIFDWHCTLRGPLDTEFEGGLYHFRISLPAEYPFKAPSVTSLTPSGRFEVNTKYLAKLFDTDKRHQICISFTSFHEDTWQPAWGIRTAILGILSLFSLKGLAASGIGALEATPNERKRLANLSRSWTCPRCQQSNLELLPESNSIEASEVQKDEAHEETAKIATQSELDSDANLSQTTTAVSPPTPPTAPDTSESHAIAALPPPMPVSSLRSTPSRQKRPPAILDGAILSLLVLLFALICRRLV